MEEVISIILVLVIYFLGNCVFYVFFHRWVDAQEEREQDEKNENNEQKTTV